MDGTSANPKLADDDPLYLDGSRLVRGVAGSGNSTTYKPVLEDFSRAEQIGTTLKAAHFVVRTKAGLRMEFGGTGDSIEEHNGYRIAWHVSKVSDSSGNFYTVRYVQMHGQVLPLEISYTGNDRAKLKPFAQVRFTYHKAPVPIEHFEFGWKRHRGSLLERIDVLLHGELERSFHLYYEQAKYWPFTNLTRIEIKFPSGASISPTVFTYTEHSPAWRELTGYKLPVALSAGSDRSSGILLGDISGDGAGDLLFAHADDPEGVSTYRSSVTGWSKDSDLAAPDFIATPSGRDQAVRLLDVNRDGKKDFVVADAAHTQTHLAGKGWTLSEAHALPFPLYSDGYGATHLIEADFDSDGTSETLWSNGERFGAVSMDASGIRVLPAFFPPQAYDNRSASDVRAVALDVDCDSRTELLYVTKDSVTVYGRVGSAWQVLNGARYLIPKEVHGRTTGSDVADLNADGCNDLLLQLESGNGFAVATSKGKGATLLALAPVPISLATDAGMRLHASVDLNGDGRADLIGIGLDGTPRCVVNAVDHWAPCTNGPVLAEGETLNKAFIDDINGDGRQDLLLVLNSEKEQVRAEVFLAGTNGLSRALAYFPERISLGTIEDVLAHRTVDLNADGLPDILVLSQKDDDDDATAYINTGSGWREEKHFSLNLRFGNNFPLKSLQLIDWTGDGLADASACVRGSEKEDNCVVFENACAFTSEPMTNCWTKRTGLRFPTFTHDIRGEDLGVRLADLNADGLVDVILAREERDEKLTRQTWIFDGSGWTEVETPIAPIAFVGMERRGRREKSRDRGVQLRDLNGDRLPDIWRAQMSARHPPKSDCSLAPCLEAYIREDSDWLLSKSYAPPLEDLENPDGKDLWTSFQDLNGDGLDDLLSFRFSTRVSRAHLNTGNGWLENKGLAAPSDLFAAGLDKTSVQFFDVNADGVADAIRSQLESSNNETKKVYLGGGDQWVPGPTNMIPTPPLSSHSAGDLASRFIDVTGDGNPDVLFGLLKTPSSSRATWASPTTRSGLLVRVSTGIGVVTEISHGRALLGEFWRARSQPVATFRYPLLRLAIPSWNVASVTTKMPGSSAVVQEFAYGDMVLDVKRAAPLGFTWKQVSDSGSGIVTRTHYSLQRHLEGLVSAQSTLVDGAERQLSRTQYMVLSSNDCRSVGAAACVVVLPKMLESSEADASGTTIRSVKQVFEHDNRGNVTRNVLSFLDGSSRTIDSTYADDIDRWFLGRLQATRVTTVAADGQRIVSAATFEYDETTGLLMREEANSHSHDKLAKEYVRDFFGNILSVTSTGAAAWRLEFRNSYDREGRFVVQRCNALEHCETFTKRSNDGSLLSTVDVNGAETAMRYDEIGRLIHSKSATGELTTSYASVEGHQAGAILRIRTRSVTGYSDEYVDALGNVVEADRPGFGNRRVLELSRFDSYGRLRERSAPFYPGEHLRWETYEYDAIGNMRRVVDLSGRTVELESAGDAFSKRIGSQNATVQSFGAEQRVRKISDSTGRVTEFEYDAAGRQTRIRYSDGKIWEATYDDTGRRRRVVDPYRGVYSMSWTPFGELAEIENALGEKVVFEYDVLGRLIERRANGISTKWTYDVGKNGIGRLTRIEHSPDYQEIRTYSVTGALLETRYFIGREEFTEVSEYGARGEIRAIQYPSGLRVSYDYDDSGYVTEIRAPEIDKLIWRAADYSASGEVTGARLGQHLVASQSGTRLANNLMTFTLERDARVIDSMEYEFDGVGAIRARRDRLTGELHTYEFDAGGQLSAWLRNGAVVERYSYDAMGSLSVASSLVATSDRNNKHGTALETDSVGRITRYDKTKIRYDGLGYPSEVTDGTASVRYEYGPDGRVSQERWSTFLSDTSILRVGRTERIHSKGIAPLTPSGERVIFRDHIVGPAGLIGIVDSTAWVFRATKGILRVQPTTFDPNQNIAWLIQLSFVQADAMGGLRALVDEEGNVRYRQSFSPWGRATIDKNVDGTKTGFDQPFGFSGHSQIRDLDLIRMGPRLYLPERGSFTSPDPVPSFARAELAIDFNPYSYARNNPLAYGDPSGLGLFEKIVGGVVGFALGGPLGALVGVGVASTSEGSRFINEYWRPAASIAVGIAITVASGGTLGPVAAAMVGGAVASGLNVALYGGNSADVLRAMAQGAVIGAISASAGAIAAHNSAGVLGQMTAGGVAGAFSSSISGGSLEEGFRVGVLAAGLSILARNYSLDKTTASRIATRAIVAGTVSTIEGGKFGNAALTAAYAATVQGLAADAIKPGRALHKEEITKFSTLLRSKGLDPSVIKFEDVRVVNGRFFELVGNAITPYGTVFMGDEPWSANYAAAAEGWKTFAHEMAHVHQYYSDDAVALRGLYEQIRESLPGKSMYCTPGTQEYAAERISATARCQ